MPGIESWVAGAYRTTIATLQCLTHRKTRPGPLRNGARWLALWLSSLSFHLASVQAYRQRVEPISSVLRATISLHKPTTQN